MIQFQKSTFHLIFPITKCEYLGEIFQFSQCTNQLYYLFFKSVKLRRFRIAQKVKLFARSNFIQSSLVLGQCIKRAQRSHRQLSSLTTLHGQAVCQQKQQWFLVSSLLLQLLYDLSQYQNEVYERCMTKMVRIQIKITLLIIHP